MPITGSRKQAAEGEAGAAREVVQAVIDYYRTLDVLAFAVVACSSFDGMPQEACNKKGLAAVHGYKFILVPKLIKDGRVWIQGTRKPLRR